MLRAAVRKHQRHHQLAADFQQLYLPFLCPAQLRWQSTHTKSLSTRSKTQTLPSRPDRSYARNLASLAGVTAYDSSSSQPHYPSADNQPILHWTFDGKPREPIILRHDLSRPTPAHNAKKAIAGGSAELLQSLYTCIRVNRFKRAEDIIQRMSEQADATDAKILHARETYLFARLQEITSEPGVRQNWEAIREFFEKEMVERSATISDKAYITIIRAAMAGLDGSERDTVVQEYADRSGIPHELLIDEPSLNDREYLTIGAILGKSLNLEQQSTSEEISSSPDSTDKNDVSYNLSPSDLPRVLEVRQKGLGLASVKQGLKVFEVESQSDTSIIEELDPQTAKLRAIEREKLIEESAMEAAVERWHAEEQHLQSLGVSSNLHSRPMAALMWQWYSALLPKVREEMSEVQKAMESTKSDTTSDERRLYGAQFESLSPESIAANTVLYMVSTTTRGKDRETGNYTSAIKVTIATHNLGRSLQDESNAEAAKRRTDTVRKDHAGKKRRLAKNPQFHSETTAAAQPLEWSSEIRVKIGALLISKFIEAAKFPITREHPRTKQKMTKLQPAFVHKTVYRLGKKQGLICASPELVDKLHREPLGSAVCKRLPMIVEPVPWTGFRDGGYLNYPTDFIRFPPTDQTPRDYALAAIAKGDMNQVFDALNVLSSIPWRINKDVLRVQIEAWNTGEAVGNFAPLDMKMDIPPEPAHSSDPNAKRRWLQDVQELENKRVGYHSQRCHQNFQLEIARAFRSETIYFPHNVDFRGRAYPVPPYLNHMGADNARGLLIFAKGKELGTKGLRWLKIHLANIAGYDKASLQEREDYTMQHLDDIFDSAEKPLTGRKWWLESEDAWQTLAACCELRNAMKSPEPTKFVSHLPIHQDGTCNGLQHYAALGGDEIGARQVNLEPGDRPADVYTAVADSVRAEVLKDFEADHPIAKILHGRITRKVVKQPVMTNVYGVTYYGAKAQVRKQLEELFPDIHRSALINHGTMAAYIARKIFQSLGEMFKGAQAIQEWLGVCADRISTCVTPEQVEELTRDGSRTKEEKIRKKSGPKPTKQVRQDGQEKLMFKSSVIWTTPLRLPVVQPYRSPTKRVVKTSLQHISLQAHQRWDPVSRKKQLQGFPPNFIHSLDATHMMLSALQSQKQGMTFASIHDSFWTHASDIDDLGTLLRDAFVHMHSEDIIGRLREEMIARYEGSFYLASVDSAGQIGQQLKDQQHAIKRERKAFEESTGLKLPKAQLELLMEKERLRLLNSKKAADRKKGAAMVTPGAIFATNPEESAIALPDSITESGLGAMPVEDASTMQEQDEAGFETAEPVLEESEEMDDDQVDESYEGNVHMARKRLINLDSTSPTSGATTTSEKTRKKQVRKDFIWLPLAFPPVPEKGSFDVKRLKESRYFFH